MNMEVSVVCSKSGKAIARLHLSKSSTVADAKAALHRLVPHLHAGRTQFRKESRGKDLKEDDSLTSLGIKDGDTVYLKDLGPQIGWTTVFLTEYAGPLFVYAIFYARPAIIYGAQSAPRAPVVNIAAACWTFHYAKRLLETVFVHRFSHGTMPILNLFKNSGYYWGFAAWVAYFVNHPLYTPASFGLPQIYGALAAFIVCELGNFSIHLSLRNLRPPGTKARAVPRPTANPFTYLFKYVSCANYTYETFAWLSFSVMTQCLPALVFTAAGFYQMAVWALGKHAAYKREFKDYPKGRKAIVPFLL